MNRFLSVLNFNKKFYTFAANLSKTASAKEFPVTEIDDAIRKVPELQKFSKEQWQATFETLIREGFGTSTFMKIIGKRPHLLRRSPDKLIESLECLRQTQFGDKSILELIEEHPELLEYTNSAELRKKLAYIRSYADTQKNIFRLFFSSPNIITDKEIVIERKIKYLTNVMKVDVTDVAKSKVFSLPLEEIKCRHVFLFRLGLFKPKNPKVDPLQPSKNPKMSYIYDTTDREFAVKTCGVTLEEFETFRELYKRERDNKYVDDDENDNHDNDED